MLEQLNDYDWAEVFGEGCGSNCTAILPGTIPGDTKTSPATFGREDVVLIKGQSEGENDVRSWIVWGLLKDGRWFFAEGSCDYTGWECRASNGGFVASSEADLIRYGMTDEDRERFGLVLEDSRNAR